MREIGNSAWLPLPVAVHANQNDGATEKDWDFEFPLAFHSRSRK